VLCMITHMPCAPSKASLAMVSFASLRAASLVCAAALLLAAAAEEGVRVEPYAAIEVDVRLGIKTLSSR
jgi:hypothetical protein